MDHTARRGALSRLVTCSIIFASVLALVHVDAAYAWSEPSELDGMSVRLDLRQPTPDEDGSYISVPLAQLQFTTEGLEPVPPPDVLLLQEYIDGAVDSGLEALELQITLLDESEEAVWHQWVELHPPSAAAPIWRVESLATGSGDSEVETSAEVVPLSEIATIINDASPSIEPLLQGASGAGGGCSGDYAGTGWWASSNYLNRNTSAVRVYTSARANWSYDWANTSQSRYEIAAKSSSGAYSAGLSRSNDRNVQHYQEFDGNDYDRHVVKLELKFRQYAFRCYKYDSAGKRVWTTYLGLYEYRPHQYTYGASFASSTNVFKCTSANQAETTASRVGVSNGTSVTWSNSYSIYGLTLDNTQGESTSHDFSLSRRSGYSKFVVCTRRNSNGSVLQIRER